MITNVNLVHKLLIKAKNCVNKVYKIETKIYRLNQFEKKNTRTKVKKKWMKIEETCGILFHKVLLILFSYEA